MGFTREQRSKLGRGLWGGGGVSLDLICVKMGDPSGGTRAEDWVVPCWVSPAGRGPLEPLGQWACRPLEGAGVLQFSLELEPAWKCELWGVVSGTPEARRLLSRIPLAPSTDS